MRRFFVLNVMFTVFVTMLAGCDEASFNQPVVVPDDIGSSATVEAVDAEPVQVHDWIGQPGPGLNEEAPRQPARASKVNSIFNALKNGAAGAMEESNGVDP